MARLERGFRPLLTALLVCMLLPFYVAVVSAFPSGSLSHSPRLYAVSVTIKVEDLNGLPVSGAWVKAFSEDWGVMYPHYEEWGITDSAGVYRFRIVNGNWTFIASSGWSGSNPGTGFFIAVNVYVDKDATLTLKPQKQVSVKVVDEFGSPLQVDELYVILSRTIPAVPPALIGSSPSGMFSLFIGGDLKGGLNILAVKRSHTDSYLLVGKASLDGPAVISARGAAKISFEAYNPDHTFSEYWDVEFRLPDLYYGNWVFTFQVYGKTTVKVSPTDVVLNPRFIPPGWYYYFEHIALRLRENDALSYRFGGKGTFNLWVIKGDTQLWFDVHDEFGNVLGFYSDSSGNRDVRLGIFEKSVKVYDENIGVHIPGIMFYGVGRTFSSNATFKLSINLGPLGGLGTIEVEGLLYDEKRLAPFRTLRTENFEVFMPTDYFFNVSGQVRTSVFLDSLERIYKAMGEYLSESLSMKPHRVEVNFEWCGVGGQSFVGFGVGIARWPTNIHPGYLGILSHELGHMYSFTPPLIYYVECPVYCEPLATYLGIEAVAKVYGDYARLWYWGQHPRLLDYILGFAPAAKTPGEEVEHMQFILFYIHRVYGSKAHLEAFKLFDKSSEAMSKLSQSGFNSLETIFIIFSYIVNDNLAWLAQLAGFNVTEQRVTEGVRIIKSLGHTFTGKVTVNGKAVLDGSIVSARIGGVEYANGSVRNGYFNFRISPDDPDTPGKEGGENGDIVEIYVKGFRSTQWVYAGNYTFKNGGTSVLDLNLEDKDPPRITVENLPGLINKRLLTIRGTFSEAFIKNIVVKVNENTFPATLVADGIWEATISLAEGANTLLVRAEDLAGNTAETSITVFTDTTPPACFITINDVTRGYIRGISMLNVSVYDDNFLKARLTLNGTLIESLDKAGNFTLVLDTSRFSDGLYVLRLEAEDRAGNIGYSETPVVIDNSPPVIKAVNPSNGSVLWKDFNVTLESYDLTSGIKLIQVYLDNSLVANLTEPAPVSLRNVTPGEHTIKVMVMDKAGNIASTRVTVRVMALPLTAVIIAIVIIFIMILIKTRKKQGQK